MSRYDRSDLILAAFEARNWHSGQWCPFYAFQCGDFSLDSVQECAALAGYIEDVAERLYVEGNLTEEQGMDVWLMLDVLNWFSENPDELERAREEG